jgi:hypothetical protein
MSPAFLYISWPALNAPVNVPNKKGSAYKHGPSSMIVPAYRSNIGFLD